MLRASGIEWDLRKVDHYESYDEFDWRFNGNKRGFTSSLFNPEWNDFEYRFISKKPSPTFELSKQERYVRVEAPKRRIGNFLIGDHSVFLGDGKFAPKFYQFAEILPREISAGIQQRIGPEYAGPLGILQSLADGTKLLLKENLIPSTGDTRLFSIRPSHNSNILSLSYSVIPFGDHLVLADLSIGVFYGLPFQAAAQSVINEIPLALCVLSISLREIR
ncbi:hypothetical protein HAX54_002316, partial [Datura stramonium]|nr:hypothetical protein [Datura stramonium]